MSADPPRFWAPAFGLMLLFGALGPLIGGAVFLPLMLALAAPAAAAGTAHLGWAAMLFGHSVVIFFAYVIGLGPAAFTGFLLAVYDRFGGAVLPRSVVAALIGGGLSLAMFYRLAAIGVGTDASLRIWVGDDYAEWTEGFVGDNFDAILRAAMSLSGAFAGFVCALAAALVGLKGHAP